MAEPDPGCWDAWFNGLAYRLACGYVASIDKPKVTLEGEAMGEHPMHTYDAVKSPDYRVGQIYEDDADD